MRLLEMMSHLGISSLIDSLGPLLSGGVPLEGILDSKELQVHESTDTVLIVDRQGDRPARTRATVRGREQEREEENKCQVPAQCVKSASDDQGKF